MAEVNIHPEGGYKKFEEEEAVEHVAPRSFTPLEGLRDRYKQIRAELYKDIQIPRWNEPALWARFKAVDMSKLSEASANRQKKGGSDWTLLSSADVLVNSCIGVYAVYDSDPDTKYSLREDDPHGEWTRFDKDLADALGLDTKSHAETCRKVFLTDGDLLSVADALIEWSNNANNEADSAF